MMGTVKRICSFILANLIITVANVVCAQITGEAYGIPDYDDTTSAEPQTFRNIPDYDDVATDSNRTGQPDFGDAIDNTDGTLSEIPAYDDVATEPNAIPGDIPALDETTDQQEQGRSISSLRAEPEEETESDQLDRHERALERADEILRIIRGDEDNQLEESITDREK